MKIKLINHGYEKLPNRAHHNDSGADVFCIEDTWVPAGRVVSIGTGVGVELPDGFDIVVHDKSSLSSKGLFIATSPVDAGYKGEIHVIVFNTTNQDYVFHKGDKLGQFVVRPVIYADFVESFNEEERGSGAFGSTGK